MAESEGSLRALIRRRGTFKAKLTLFDKYLEEFESLDDDTRGRTKVLELEQRTNNAETLLAGFDEVQSDIECEVDDFDEQYAERQEFQDKYYSLLSRAKCLLQNLMTNVNQLPLVIVSLVKRLHWKGLSCPR
nr:unnamed protein product [Callosobruchus chinensis]